MEFEFEWDPVKAQTNWRKHGISFIRAVEVFRDPLAISIPDSQHSDDEERWISIGKDAGDAILVVIHTYAESHSHVRIRVISARRATRTERVAYNTEQ